MEVVLDENVDRFNKKSKPYNNKRRRKHHSNKRVN